MSNIDPRITDPQITGPDSIREWFDRLLEAGVSFHTEETFAQITEPDGRPAFSPADAARMDAAMARCGDVVDDPAAIGVAAFAAHAARGCYPMGATVTFADANATTSSADGAVARGTVNGRPLDHETVGGGITIYVPVFAARDNGREATTVYVHESNVLTVDRPERNPR